jgi:predicted transcriptional regulator
MLVCYFKWFDVTWLKGETLEIDASILLCAKSNVYFTKLMYACNVTYSGLKNLLEMLEKKGLLAHQDVVYGKNGSLKKVYSVSKLGKRLLALYFEL